MYTLHIRGLLSIKEVKMVKML